MLIAASVFFAFGALFVNIKTFVHQSTTKKKKMSEETNPIVNEELPAESPLKGVKAYKALFPVLIGLGVVAFIFYREFRPEALSFVSWTPSVVLWFLVALLFMFGRDLGYIWRIRILSDKRLSFKQAFRIIYRSGFSLSRAIEEMEMQLDSSVEIENLLRFLRNADRGIMRTRRD